VLRYIAQNNRIDDRRMDILKKIRRNYRDFGSWVTLVKIVGVCVKPVVEIRTFIIYLLDFQHYTIKEIDNSSFIFIQINRNDTNILGQIGQMEEWLIGDIENKISHGALCIAALDAGKVAGFNLVDFNETHLPLIHFRWKLGARESFSVQISVHKNYRGRGLATLLRFAVFNELKKRGYAKLYGATQLSNIANLALSKKVGFKFIIKVTYYRLLFFKGITCLDNLDTRYGKMYYMEITDDKMKTK
jgi:GNAT superfamily N-acetyltransferase